MPYGNLIGASGPEMMHTKVLWDTPTFPIVIMDSLRNRGQKIFKFPRHVAMAMENILQNVNGLNDHHPKFLINLLPIL